MKYNLLHLALILCLFFTSSYNTIAFATSDTISGKDTIVTSYKYLKDLNNNLFTDREVNKSLHGFQVYFPPNTNMFSSYKDLFISQLAIYPFEFGFKNHLGNLGTATNRMFFQNNIPFGSDIGFTAFDNYILTPNNSKFYKLEKPYTELYYVAGSKREQIFNIQHAQTIKSNLRLGFNFNKINSTGFYSHQKSDHSNFSAQLQYTSNNKRYNIIGNTVFTKISSQENGGLLSDSLFENVVNVTKSAIPTFLDSAENNWKGRSYLLKQIYLLGRHTKNNNNDTIDSSAFMEKSKLFHSLEYSTWKRAYNDYFPDLNYYPAIYHDTLITADTLFSSSIKQSIGWSNAVLNKIKTDTLNPAIFEIDISHEYFEYHHNDVDSFVNNISINTKIGRIMNTGFSWNLKSGYIIYGDNKNDIKLGGIGSYSWGNNKNTISLLAKYQNSSPSYVFQRFDSNHYRWENQFVKTKTTKARIDYSQINNKFSLGIQGYLIDRYIYLDEAAIPAQMDNLITVYGAYLRKDFSRGNWAYNSRLAYQFVEDSIPIRVPEFTFYQSISFSNWLFKKALFVKLGFDLYYNTAYLADAYSPALASFYIQNQNQIGNYPYVDFYACFRIKKARLFFLISHLNAGWFGNNYYLTPHYPAQDLSLKFGASWMFYD